MTTEHSAKLDELIAEAAERTEAGLKVMEAQGTTPEEGEDKSAPCYSNAGNLRSLKAMNPVKFEGVLAEMQAYKDKAPKGYAAVVLEKERREREGE